MIGQPGPLPPHLIGGNFLFCETDPALIHTPEDRSVEVRHMAETAERFMDREVFPRIGALERKEEGLARKLFREAVDLGLLGVEMPEEYGGLGQKRALVGVFEQLQRLAGFGVMCGSHLGIGSHPLAYFGTVEQKRKYLPRLIRGEWMAAYCLTEAESGSDALGMKSRAVLSPDGGHYVLTGSKMWISNGGWADLLTVFAKVDGEHVTAFLVERNFPGISTGPEEHKLGIKMSSTRRVMFDQVKVPADNVLGEVGKGAYIAFNILNFGRLTLAMGLIGGAKDQIRAATGYAMERKQFGKALIAFGLIAQKLAEMAAKTFAAESAVNRIAGAIDAVEATGEMLDLTAPGFSRALEEFALECSIVKVQCSEILFQVADESLQIHGGYGFSEEFTPARALRDSRINRIFEGTSEINRLFIPTALLRRGQRGRLPWAEALERVGREGLDMVPDGDGGDPLANALNLLVRAKRLAFYLGGLAGERISAKRDDDQIVAASWADIVCEIFMAESAVLRARKTGRRDGGDSVQADLASLFVNESVARMESSARRVLNGCLEPGRFPREMQAVRHLLAWTPSNAASLHRKIVERMGRLGRYPG